MLKNLFLLSFLLLLVSCKKSIQLEKCTGHCKTYTIKGRVYDAINNIGFKSANIKVRWETFRSNCIFCPESLDDVFNGKTDSDGNFTISFTVDTTLFQDYSLKLITPEKENYYNSFTGYLERSDLNQSSSVNIAFYPTTNLTLHIFRTLNDPFDVFRIAYKWKQTHGSGKDTFREYNYFGRLPNQNGDTTLYIQTAADIVTVVTLTKYLSGNFRDVKDSLICRRGFDNVLTMNY